MSIRESITDKYGQDPVGIERRHRGRLAGRAVMRAWFERMAGELSAESSPGRTTFALELPA